MAKDRRWNDHPRVITLLPDFQIRTTRQRDFDLDKKIVRSNGRNRHLLNPYIFATVQHGRHHVPIASCPHGKITTFKEFSAG